MLDLLYQKWYFPRPELAQRILTLLMDGPGDPVALVGERRIGKTTLLLFELMPLAKGQGLLPVYVDVYQHRADPLAAINYALPIFYTTSEKLTPIQSHTARSKGRGTTLTVTLEGGAVEQLF